MRRFYKFGKFRTEKMPQNINKLGKSNGVGSMRGSEFPKEHVPLNKVLTQKTMDEHRTENKII